jgi:small subunit ribosomal protein S13
MAEKEKQDSKKTEEKAKKEKPEDKKKSEHHQPQQIRAENVVRILSTDIPSTDNIYSGLTKIKGISWGFSNALCNFLNIDKKKKFSTLSESEIEKITSFIKNPTVPDFILNRRKDKTTGNTTHLITSDLDFQRDMDIRGEKKIRSLKGWRHALGQPVRGQKTRSHFRKGKAIGVQRKKSAPAKSPAKSSK